LKILSKRKGAKYNFLDKIEFVIYNCNRVKGKRKEAVAKLTERTIHGNKIGDGAEGTFEF